MNAPCLPNTDHRESSDRYRGEVFRLDGWRVVVCRDGIQWILQAATRARCPDGPRWEGRRYCTTRAALIRLWMAATGDHGTALVAILPDRIGGRPAGV